jgi:hypothetical protein
MKKIEAVIQPFKLDEARVGHRGHVVSSWEHDSAPSYLTRNSTSLKSYLKTLRRKFHEAG